MPEAILTLEWKRIVRGREGDMGEGDAMESRFGSSATDGTPEESSLVVWTGGTSDSLLGIRS